MLAYWHLKYELFTRMHNLIPKLWFHTSILSRFMNCCYKNYVHPLIPISNSICSLLWKHCYSCRYGAHSVGGFPAIKHHEELQRLELWMERASECCQRWSAVTGAWMTRLEVCRKETDTFLSKMDVGQHAMRILSQNRTSSLYCGLMARSTELHCLHSHTQKIKSAW